MSIEDNIPTAVGEELLKLPRLLKASRAAAAALIAAKIAGADAIIPGYNEILADLQTAIVKAGGEPV